MTSWIFSSGYCTCSATGSGELLNPKINRNRATKRTAEYEKPNRTNLDENGFPLLGSRYKITDPIGIGGMGEIYRVREEGHEGLLAVKLLRDEYARDKTCVNRLKKEALTASTVKLCLSKATTVRHAPSHEIDSPIANPSPRNVPRTFRTA